MPIPNEADQVPGYFGLYNFKDYFWVTAGSRLYGPRRHINLGQDLARDFDDNRRPDREDFFLYRLLNKPLTATAKRILTAVEWFNTANSSGANNEASAIVNLTIAFETLLSLPMSDKTDRLTDAISLLLGRIPKLDEWAREFYNLRSSIVHEGRRRQQLFVPSSKKVHEPRRPLFAYGSRVFQLCVATLLVGAQMAEVERLEGALVTDQTRFDNVCRVLGDKSANAEDRLQQCVPIIATIGQYLFAWENKPKVETMLTALCLAARTLVELDSEHVVGVKEQLIKFATIKKRADLHEEIDALRSIKDIIVSHMDSQFNLESPERDAFHLFRIVWEICEAQPVPQKAPVD